MLAAAVDRQVLEEWTDALGSALNTHGVPGASVAVAVGDDTVTLTAGVTDPNDRVPVTADTAFQCASIAKLYTATLLGGVAGGEDLLDRSVASLVPEAAGLDPSVTVRHLLSHTSGLAGDVFTDTGPGDDALARFVSLLAGLPKDIPGPAGQRYSYCNSGFALLGRLVECLVGQPFPLVMRRRLLDPLGGKGAALLPDQEGLDVISPGHPVEGGTAGAAVPPAGYPRSMAPLGGLAATGAGLLDFARLHLRRGRTGDGTQVVPGAWIDAMARPAAAVPAGGHLTGRGLGWAFYGWRGGTVLGHDGEVRQQIASLRLVPEAGLALAVLTNGAPAGAFVTREVEQAVLGHWGLRPVLPRPVADRVPDPRRYEGTYANHGSIIRVESGRDGVTMHYVEDPDEPSGTGGTALAPTGRDGVLVTDGRERPAEAIAFGDADGAGRYRSLYEGTVTWRVAPREERR